MRWSWMTEVVERVITFVGREKVPFARSRRVGRSQREWTVGFHVASDWPMVTHPRRQSISSDLGGRPNLQPEQLDPLTGGLCVARGRFFVPYVHPIIDTWVPSTVS